MKDKIITMYEYLYGISSGDRNFCFVPSERDSVMIDNFVNKLTPSNGDDWLFNFMCYQFSRYVDQKTRFGKGRIMLGWVIGDKAINKYKTASSEEIYYADEFKSQYSVKNIIFTPQKIEISKEYLDRERSRFFGNERGLVHCTENKLYDIRSKWCVGCKFKTYCNV